MGRNRKRKRSARDPEPNTMASASAQPDQSTGSRFAVLSDEPGSDGEPSPDHVPTKAEQESAAGQAWSTVPPKRPAKKRKLPKKDSPNYPSISYSELSRLQSTIKVSDLQSLVLYILANGASPHWIAVRHYTSIRKVVVLMVPGFERRMFNKDRSSGHHAGSSNGGAKSRDVSGTGKSNAHDGSTMEDGDRPSMHAYRPLLLSRDELQEPLRPLCDMFGSVWPVDAPGDNKYYQMHSPILAMLVSPLPKSNGKKVHGAQPPREAQDWEDRPCSVVEMVATADQLRENDFAVHPALLETDEQKAAESHRRQKLQETDNATWIDTNVDKPDLEQAPTTTNEPKEWTAGREVLAIDCEMCRTSDNLLALTRIAIVHWDGTVVMDELVKPEKAIINYLTPFSGITAEMLEPVTTTLADIQARLLGLLHANAILVGHSLNADLAAIGITHPYIVDTSIIYPHPRGFPLKSSLKWLAQKYLGREIQQGHGSSGHDPIEDAVACLDLVKQKCQRGLMWGTKEASSESIFKRIGRTPVPTKYATHGTAGEGRTGAVVDWGRPEKGVGGPAAVCVGCQNDDEVVEGVKTVVNGDKDAKLVPAGGVDFVWARLRELGLAQGWWAEEPQPAEEAEDVDNGLIEPSVKELEEDQVREALAATVRRISDIYDSLPPCTAFLVYSGTGDPREMARLQAQMKQFRREFATRKWDELSVRWTDTEEQQLREATKLARQGVAMMIVK